MRSRTTFGPTPTPSFAATRRLWPTTPGPSRWIRSSRTPGTARAMPTAAFSKLIGLAPKAAAAWPNRGLQYAHLHEYDKALVHYAKAMELDPKLAPAWNNRGGVYRELQQYDKALADFCEAIKLDPKYAL